MHEKLLELHTAASLLDYSISPLDLRQSLLCTMSWEGPGGSTVFKCACMQAGNASVDVFGVFDGHGGKQAAVYASKHMMGAVLTALNERIGQNQEQTQDEVQNGMCIPAKRDANHEGEPMPSLISAHPMICMFSPASAPFLATHL